MALTARQQLKNIRAALDEEEAKAIEECGRWRNGTLAPVTECLNGGTEDCQFCPCNKWN